MALWIKYISPIILILIFILSGCASFKSWDRPTQVMFTGLVAGQVADYAITEYALDNGCSEENPIFDGHPERMIPIKLALLVGAYWLTEWIEPEHRKWFLIPANIITWGVVLHNYGETK